MTNRRIVFTKPWRELPLGDLADTVRNLGFDGIELPVRPGFQVEPENVESTLREAVDIFAEREITVYSVAAEPEQPIIEACGKVGIDLIRTMVRIDLAKGYRRCVDEEKRRLEMLYPELRANSVRVGVQNHCDFYIGSAVGIMDLIAPLDPDAVCAVLDLAHCALDGEPEEMAVDIVAERLGLVNLKSAFRRRINDREAAEARWQVSWCTAKDSGYSWKKAVHTLVARGYRGPICLPAEYTAEASNRFLENDDVLPLLSCDLIYLDSLLG